MLEDRLVSVFSNDSCPLSLTLHYEITFIVQPKPLCGYLENIYVPSDFFKKKTTKKHSISSQCHLLPRHILESFSKVRTPLMTTLTRLQMQVA